MVHHAMRVVRPRPYQLLYTECGVQMNRSDKVTAGLVGQKVIYDSTCVPHVDFVELSEDSIRSRGNKFKLIQHHCHYALRIFNFTNRVIPIWSSLSNHVVSADTVNTFKNRLYNFWSTQEVMHDYKADLHGIGNRSIIV